MAFLDVWRTKPNMVGTMSNRAVEEVERRIRDLEMRIARLRRIRELLANDPALGDELLSLVTQSPNGMPESSLAQQPRLYGSPLVDQVVAHYKATENRWQTVREISDAIGLSRNSLNGLLYTSRHREIFETDLQGPKRRVFRLRAPAVPQPQPAAEPQPPPQPPPDLRAFFGGVIPKHLPKHPPAGWPKDQPWPPPRQSQ